MARLIALIAIATGGLLASFMAIQPAAAQAPNQEGATESDVTPTPEPTIALPPTLEISQETQVEGTPQPPIGQPLDRESPQGGQIESDRPVVQDNVDWSSVRMEGEGASYFPHSAVPLPSHLAEPDYEQIVPSGEATPTPFGAQRTHIVQSGDTLSGIAQYYGVSMVQLAEANSIQNPNRILRGQVLMIPGTGSVPLTTAQSVQQSEVETEATTYTVQPGDVPFQIAQRYGISAQLLMTANQIRDPRRLKVGQVLSIPQDGNQPPAASTAAASSPVDEPGAANSARQYQVQRGENLFRISLRFRVSVQALISANKLANPDRIHAGQILTIPDVPKGSPAESSMPAQKSAPTLRTAMGPGETNHVSGGELFIWPIPLQDGWIPQWFWSGHPGVDIILPTGTPILAAAGGTIEFSGWNNQGFGNLVVIDHGNGYRSLYAHQSERHVETGDTVSQGDVVGLVGSTGRSTHPHLHFELREGFFPLNPCNYLPGGCES